MIWSPRQKTIYSFSTFKQEIAILIRGVFIHGWKRESLEYRRTHSSRTIKELWSGRRWTPFLTQNWQNVTKSWIWPRSNSKNHAAFAKLPEAVKCQSCCSDTMGLREGDIGGYPIPQYRKKKWQIPKYLEENRPNTDTAYFNHIYNRFRMLMVASI